MQKEIYSQLRGISGLGVVIGVNDTGQAQTATVLMADGITRADVEVLQPFGFASVPTEQGGICLLMAAQADPANLVALPIAAPSQRFGEQAAGETTMYAADGTRVSLRQGGVVEIWGGTSVTINSPGVTINAPNGVAINGPLSVSGDITVAGKSVLNHVHPDPQGGVSGVMQG